MTYNASFVPAGAPSVETYDGESYILCDILVRVLKELSNLQQLHSEQEYNGMKRTMLCKPKGAHWLGVFRREDL